MILREREIRRKRESVEINWIGARSIQIRYKLIRDDVVMIDDVTRSEVGLCWIHSVTSYLLLYDIIGAAPLSSNVSTQTKHLFPHNDFLDID